MTKAVPVAESSADRGTPPAPRARSLPPLFGPGRLVAELVLAGVVAVVVSLALQFLVNRMSPILPGTNVLIARMFLVSAVLIVVAFGLLGLGVVARFPGWLKHAGSWAMLSGLVTLVLALPLRSTRFYLGGVSVDNSFRLQYMERMASTTRLADINYDGVAAYYPGGWFWLGGRFAELFGMRGWEAYKPYAILWCALAAAITYVLWSLVVRRRTAFLASVLTLLAGLVTSGVEEPYAWPTTAWLPPIAVLAWTVLRRRERAAWWPFVLVGVYLGLCAVTYTLHLGFAAALVVLLAVMAAVLAIREGERAGVVVPRLVLRVAVVAAISAVLAAIVWAPFILDGGLGLDNDAPRFLPSGSAYFPMPFLPDSVMGVLCLLGLGWSVLRARRDRIAFVLLTTTALVYVWFALSTLALSMNTTLLSFRFIATVKLLLALAGLFGALELVRLARAYRATWQRPVLALAVVLAVLGSVSIIQSGVRGSYAEVLERAQTDYYPGGHKPGGARDTADDGAWNGELIAAIDQLGTGEPTEENVLTDYTTIMSFRPYWGFQTTPHYANPLGQFRKRFAEIATWGTATSSGDLARRMHDGPFEAPTMLVLRKRDDGTLLYNNRFDTFPQKVPVGVEPVVFEPALFDSPRFERRDVGPFAVIAVR